MVMPTPEEIEAQEKEKLFLDDTSERKAKLQTEINQLQSQQESLEAQLVDIEIARVKAQKLLEELETRYPTPEVPE
jgi:septal ring factor EnvC (AmiA/AmiB activator)